MFKDRSDAGAQLAALLAQQTLVAPVVLGIPRGGVVVADAIARRLPAELDIVFARKLRAPHQAELAIGALGEDGAVHLTSFARDVNGVTEAYIREEIALQRQEIDRRNARFRAIRPAIPITDRSVILTDDGIATGATMIAALHCLRAARPQELIVAVPVVGPDALASIRPLCDRVEALLTPMYAGSVGSYYWNFDQVEDDEVMAILQRSAERSQPNHRAEARTG